MKKLVEKLLKYITYFFAALLLLSYLSVHVPPSSFWPLAFLGLAYPYLLLINIVFLFFWFIKWKRIAIVLVIVILIGFNHARNTIPEFPGKKNDFANADTNNLKILSYNVRAFNIYEWLKDPNTHKGIFNFIRSEHPDIICIQEFFTNDKSEFSPQRYSSLFGETPYSHIEYSHKHSNNTGFGIATFSRYPIINRGAINFKESLNLSSFTDIEYGGDTIRVFNCHLQSVNLRLSNYEFLDSLRLQYGEQQMKELQDLSVKLKNAFIKRSAQAQKISALIKSSPHPVVVCGDFNDTPVSYAYHKVKGKMNDAWQVAGNGLGDTYKGRLSFRIDYILYQPFFKAIEFERVKTELSDHYPIMAILRKDQEK